jgi:hypothetical protein
MSIDRVHRRLVSWSPVMTATTVLLLGPLTVPRLAALSCGGTQLDDNQSTLSR